MSTSRDVVKESRRMCLRLRCGHFFAERQLGSRPNCFVCSGTLEGATRMCPVCDEHHENHGMCLL